MIKFSVYIFFSVYSILFHSTGYETDGIYRISFYKYISTFKHDFKRTGLLNYEGPKSVFSVNWKFKVSGVVYSSPVMDSNGRIYFGSQDDYFYCINKYGKLLWKYKMASDVDSTPSIAPDGTIYVGSDDDTLYAFYPSGKLKWKYVVGADIRSSPLILTDDTVIITDYAGRLSAVKYGRLLWRIKLSSRYINGSPSYSTKYNSIYVCDSGGTVFAVSSNGTLKWQKKLNSSNNGTVVIDDKENLYVSTKYSGLYSLTRNGVVRWKVFSQISMSPSIDQKGNIVFISKYGDFFKVSPKGKVLLKKHVSGRVFGGLTVDKNNNMYFGSRDDFFYALDKNGNLIFKIRMSRDVDSTPLIDSYGNLYVGSDSGYLWSIR